MADINAANPPADAPCAPPDLNPRKPSIAVPPHACDCHAQIFGPPERYPYRMVRPYTPSAAGIDDYRHMLATLGIERAVIVQAGVHHGNDVTYDALRESGGKWRGIALLDARDTRGGGVRRRSVDAGVSLE
jgi:predicted TIM-barrel fold metal-dependent hydrolase